MAEEETQVHSGVVGTQDVDYWKGQINAAQKREEKYRKRARRALDIYQLDKEESSPTDRQDGSTGVPFNILYSNTETMLPAIYNEQPRPIVSRRFKDENPLARCASEAIQRGISFSIDNPSAGYETLHPMLENAVLSALVPGRGITRFGYDADVDEYKQDKKDTASKDALGDGDLDGEVPDSTKAGKDPTAMGQPLGTEDGAGAPALPPPPQVSNERICSSVVQWDKILYGYAKRWDKVPWVAFEFNMTKKDVEKAFSPNWTNKLTFSNKDTDEKVPARNDEQKRPDNTCRVWEIWHKTNRQVVFYAEGYEKSLVKTIEDPLGLSGFFPIPEPLTMFTRIEGLVPVPIYGFYQKQAQELNRLTIRIEKITEALKVRGFYDAGVGKLAALLASPDNTLLPAEGVGAMRGEGTSLDKVIWLMPIEKLAAVLQQLLQQREAVKSVIYEITGISDILRGSSVASETATAQNIKNQWGTLRLKKVQKKVQRYVRDCFRIMAEILAEHFSEETFAKMTGLPYLPTAQKQRLQQQLQGLQAQQQQQQMMQAAQAPQSGGSPDPSGATPPMQPSAQGAGPTSPPPPDPLAQQIAQLQQQIQVPSWGEVLGLLKDELLRGFSIDVETNSTIDPEAAEDRAAMGEMLQAFAGTMQQMFPAVQAGTLPMPVLKAMLKNISKRFQFGTEMEDAVNQMPDQLQQGPNPEEVQKQAEEAQKMMDDAEDKEKDAQQKLKEVAMAQKEIEQNKQMALKEVEMAKKQAIAEIKFAQQQADLQRAQKDMQSQMKLEQDTASKEIALMQTDFQNQQQHSQRMAEGEMSLKQRDMQGAMGLQQKKQALTLQQQSMKQGAGSAGAQGGATGASTGSKGRRVRIKRDQDGSMLAEELFA